MKIAFLFDSDAPEFGGSYGDPIKRKILSTNVLQTVNRHMRCYIGDIGTFSYVGSRQERRTYADLAELEFTVYQPAGWDRLIVERLAETIAEKTVYTWLFLNITADIGERIHEALKADMTYLGAMAVDFGYPPHFVFFRSYLIEFCRIKGRQCTFFYNMGDNEDPDISLKKLFEKSGFSVSYEDVGARRTIFDNYDTIEHFKRIELFERLYASLPGIGADEASNLTLDIEELHPYLFDILFAVFDTYERAQITEQLAQASLSGRKFLEYLADTLFSPRDTPFEARKGKRQVERSHYKNRMWAYIEKTMDASNAYDQSAHERLGSEFDRLYSLFCSGLHHQPSREKVQTALADLGSWLRMLIELSPSSIRRPYSPYADEMRKFFLEVAPAPQEHQYGNPTEF